MDHLRLLCEIGELNWIFSDSASTKAFLQRIVAIVADHMQAEVCSIYLYDAEREELTLKATKGLSPESVETVRLKLGEGLVGLALQELRPVIEPIASVNPHFKYFPGILEERYEAFLVVPILRGKARIGAVTVQRRQEHAFGDQDVLALRAVASQLANIIENAQRLMTLQDPGRRVASDGGPERKFFKGTVASGGFACGEAVVVDKERFLGQVLQLDADRLYTLDDFHRAVANTERQVRDAQRVLEQRFAEDVSLIFASHLLMLKGEAFLGAMAGLIEAGDSAPAAVLKTAKHYIDLFSQHDNASLREKAHDLKDLTLRLLWNLTSGEEERSLWRDRIVVARDLFPSDLLQMASEGVGGLIVTSGGTTSHVAILARSLGVPLVIVDAPHLLSLSEKTTILLDGERGNVYVDPAPKLVADFAAHRRARETLAAETASMRPTSLTRDGCRIRLLANISLLSDVQIARDLAAEGIGLYRTELPFIVRSALPTEEEQVVVYRKLVDGLPGKPITIRTLDLGGDKPLASLQGPPQRNPALGFRSIRLCLEHRDVFAQQLRAILRACAGANAHILFPMIASIEEFREARQVLQACLADLSRERIPHHEAPKLGIMVETPAVVELIDAFAQEVDFFAIGTNDLTQYTLAVDRTNERVARWYVPHHPAVLRAIKRVVDAARDRHREVSVCGEMAHEARYLPFFLGIGVRTLSVDPIHLPQVQRTIATLLLGKAEALAREVLAQTTADAVAGILERHAETLH
ncbi:MAG TPA: phosphoenolpyruvate--protein phosphotransferase [Candidatus Methylomirabilis sp.]|nr:phosphoenolpyruvate--protein phosphotransferase [Candidatus Methylomirabilis sp.]